MTVPGALCPTRHLLAAALLALAPLPFVTGQATPAPDAKPLAFDAISIKPTQSGSGLSGQTVNGEAVISSRVMMRTPPDGYSASNVTAKSLIASAYDIKDDLISGGPSWITSTSYDVEAKVIADPATSHPLTRDQRNQMLRSLLADRFQLTTHNETKEGTIYQLTLAKGGSRLHESKPADASAISPANIPPGAVLRSGPDGGGAMRGGMIRMGGPGNLTGQGMTTAQLADLLSRQLHKTVIDKTGLTGKYDIALNWTPDSPMMSPGPEGTAPPADASGPTIFTALEEQLGLKLESTKGSITTLVIDHIEKPSEN